MSSDPSERPSDGTSAKIESRSHETGAIHHLSRFRGPIFLSERDEPNDRVRCPIHGFIKYSANERRIINHPIFQRLRMIRQLALTEFVYPGATHTRFAHSLGVMEVASQAFDSLTAKQGDRLESIFGAVAGFEGVALAKARQILRLAALLHDVGHIAFSHAAEHSLHKGMGHEALSEKIITDGELLGGLLTEMYGEDVPSLVASLISKSGPVPQFKVLQDIVSGQMDADRTDYLLRDSHYCGVDYGRFDYRRLIDSLDLIEEEGVLSIALKREGIHVFEALILARYQMSVQVYYHRLRRVYDKYLEWYFENLPEGLPQSVDDLIGLNDFDMFGRIHVDSADPALPQYQWAERIANRRHHREVFATGMDARVKQLRIARKLTDQLKSEYTDVHIFDDLAKASIHKLVQPDDRDEGGGVDVRLIRPYGLAVSVAEESQLLRDLTTEFQCVRVFADVEPESDLRNEIKARAQVIWRELGG